MVKPRGGVPRDIEVTGRDLSFKSVWREQKKEWWMREPPPRSSLDDRYKYIRPDGGEGIEDELDALESALLADKHDELNIVESSESADQYGAIEMGDEAERDDVDLGEYEFDQSVDGYLAQDDRLDRVDETETKVAEEII
ncbi:hypothetical protein PInf_018642 [Phytophthora infestans]|nr:hypothetical protein PInf_018642 [Phytophthora infestans]